MHSVLWSVCMSKATRVSPGIVAHTNTHACMHTSIYKRTHTQIHTKRTHTHTRTHAVHAHTHIHTHAHTRAHTHTRTHTNTHTNTHTHTHNTHIMRYYAHRKLVVRLLKACCNSRKTNEGRVVEGVGDDIMLVSHLQLPRMHNGARV